VRGLLGILEDVAPNLSMETDIPNDARRFLADCKKHPEPEENEAVELLKRAHTAMNEMMPHGYKLRYDISTYLAARSGSGEGE
jgi:hypothetical protein